LAQRIKRFARLALLFLQSRQRIDELCRGRMQGGERAQTREDMGDLWKRGDETG
jgi:hypothetical protein